MPGLTYFYQIFGLLMAFLSLIHKCLKLQIWLATNRTTIIFIILLCTVSILNSNTVQGRKTNEKLPSFIAF